MSEAFHIDREPDERMLIAMLILDAGPERTAALRYLRPHHFTLRYADWLNAISALHTRTSAIDCEPLIKHLATAGVYQPGDELQLIYAEIDGNYESIEQIARRVIQNYRLRYFINLMQGALNQGRKGQMEAFDASIRSARRLVYEMTNGAPMSTTAVQGATPKPAPAKEGGNDRRRSRFNTNARQLS